MMANQRGVSIVELLVSLFLSSLLMTVLIQHYLSSKRQYIDSQVILEEAFELQLVSDLLRDSIRKAGFTPCIGINWLTTADSRDLHKQLQAITVDESAPHALHIQRMHEQFSIAEILNPTHLLLQGKWAYEPRQTLLIADCYHAEVHTVRNVQQISDKTLITLTTPLFFDYSEPLYVGEWLEETFFVQTNSHGSKGLFYQLDHAEELTSQVTGFTASLQVNKTGMLAHIDLGLLTGHHTILNTKVRTP